MVLRKKSKKKVAKKEKTKNLKNKNILVKKDINNSDFFIKRITNFLIMLFKAPFLLINLIVLNMINLIKKIFSHLYNVIKDILNIFSGFRDTVFGIIFGFLSGSIGAVVMLSYFDINSEKRTEINENMYKENLNKISDLEENYAKSKLVLNNFNVVQSKIENIYKELEKISSENKDTNARVSSNKNIIESFTNQSELNSKKILTLESKVQKTSTLMLSSSKTELSNRLYLAQSLLDRLQSGVPYAPQLIALGDAGLSPALLRFANGGAPTNVDLTARLSARAGELRDAHKTTTDDSWKQSLRNELAKYVEIKPIDSSKIKGMKGVLLRAEEAISLGDLKRAILEINSLDPKARGVLEVWLDEAIAKENATKAAENILAQTNAALRNKN